MSILNQPFDSGPGLGRGPSLRVPPASAVEGATGLPVGLHTGMRLNLIDSADYEVGNSVKITNRARRFLRRHSSVGSKQAGASLP